MTEKKANKKKQLLYTTIATTIILIIIVFLLIAGLTKLLINGSVYYKIEPRKEKIAEYTKKHKETPALAWIRVQGTNIDYPVIYAWNSNEIATKLDDFTWVLDDVKSLTNYVFIIGHNIRNVSSNPLIADKNHTRFEQLPSFMYLDFTEKNKYIQYTIDGKDYLYKIFSVAIVKNSKLLPDNEDFLKSDLKEYIKESKEDSFYDFDVDVDENDNIITLATCTRFYGPTTDYTYKITGRMVRDGEKVDNYKVKENENYKPIKEAMKGGEKNEEKI